MDAFELLKKDHREAEGLITELENAAEQSVNVSHRQTFEKLKNALSLHMKIEESVIYPALEEFKETAGHIPDAFEEHEEVKEQLADMDELEPSSQEFQDILADLRDGIEHHVEEEEDELFPKAEEVLGAERVSVIGKQIEEMKGKADTGKSMSV